VFVHPTIISLLSKTDMISGNIQDIEANVLNYGAITDGVTGCTASFQKALDTVALYIHQQRSTWFYGHLFISSSTKLIGL
jgi:polygalacturonase